MAHTKRTRKSPASPAARRTAAPESTAAAVGRGTTIAFFATLALSLATAIASAAWLISTHEYTGMTATTMPNAQAPAANAATPPRWAGAGRATGTRGWASRRRRGAGAERANPGP